MSIDAVDANGSSLAVGDIVAIRAKVMGDAGGVGIIYLQILEPGGDTVRTGAEQTDTLPVFDSSLCTKE